MKSVPRISVIVTCYNYGRFVARAIDSVLDQGYENLELIVVDDGSRDDTPLVLRRYAARGRIITQENRGSIAAYNRGFAAASGDIIVLLDADDWLEPSALASIAKHWRPTLAKLQWELKIVDGEGRDLGRKFCHFDAGYDAARVRESFRRTGTYRWPVSVGNAYSRWFAEKVFPLSVEHGPDGALNKYGRAALRRRRHVAGCARRLPHSWPKSLVQSRQ
jgi:glycosyltransferase involved in cell wall biosynthesis